MKSSRIYQRFLPEHSRNLFLLHFKWLITVPIWKFPKIVVPQNGWFVMENPIKWMIWGYHYFRKHPYKRIVLYPLLCSTGHSSFLLPTSGKSHQKISITTPKKIITHGHHLYSTNQTSPKKIHREKLGLSIGSQSGCCTDRWFATLQDAAGEIQGVDLGSSSSIRLIYLRHPPTMIFFQLPGWPLRDEDVTNGVEK